MPRNTSWGQTCNNICLFLCLLSRWDSRDIRESDFPQSWVTVQVVVCPSVPGQGCWVRAQFFISLDGALHAGRALWCATHFDQLTLPGGLNLVTVSFGKMPFTRGESGKVNLGSVLWPDGPVIAWSNVLLLVSVSLATTVPFLFLRKEGLSKCGRCKQAFYCNVECQVGAGPAGKEGLISSEDQVPSVSSSLSWHSAAARVHIVCVCCPWTNRQPVTRLQDWKLGIGKWEGHKENHIRYK